MAPTVCSSISIPDHTRFRSLAPARVPPAYLAHTIGRTLVPDSWELTIFEKKDVVGGAWCENTYPGVTCDLHPHLLDHLWP